VDYCYPAVLQPGEHGYLAVNKYVETTDLALVTDHMLSLTGQGKITQKLLRLEVTARIETVTDGYWSTTRVIAVIKNTTDKPIANISTVYAVKDAANEILYVTTNNWSGYGIKLMPGSSLEMSVDLPSDTVTYFTNNSLVPAAVEAVATTTEE